MKASSCSLAISHILGNCTSLINLDGLSNVSKIGSLGLWGCPSQTNLDVLSNITLIHRLDLGNVDSVNVNQLKDLQKAVPGIKIVFR